MNQFDIFTFQPPGWNEPHPVVVISHPDRAARKDPVDVVMCSTQRASRAAKGHEFILDQADGLNWATLCKCDLIYAAPKAELTQQRGTVSDGRKAPLIRKIIEAHGWADALAHS
jgi:mRNA-degrading endonuclease toxin of MazEF toxin-antitoxin module